MIPPKRDEEKRKEENTNEKTKRNCPIATEQQSYIRPLQKSEQSTSTVSPMWMKLKEPGIYKDIL